MTLRAGDVGVDVVAHHPGHARFGVERLQRRLEVLARRFAEHDRLGVGGVLEPRDERSRVEQGPVLRLPPAILVQ